MLVDLTSSEIGYLGGLLEALIADGKIFNTNDVLMDELRKKFESCRLSFRRDFENSFKNAGEKFEKVFSGIKTEL